MSSKAMKVSGIVAAISVAGAIGYLVSRKNGRKMLRDMGEFAADVGGDIKKCVRKMR